MIRRQVALSGPSDVQETNLGGFMRAILGSARLITAVVVAGAMISTRSYADSRDPANYVGPKMCGICHKADDNGNALAKWQASPHAKAFELLGTPEAKAAGTKLGVDNPQTSGKCLRCHSTAYNFTESVATEKIKPEDGVTCESCHGPGKKYMIKSTMEDHAKAVEAGLVYPASKSCEMCHNNQNPTWKPDRYTTKDGKKVGFDYEQAFAQIAHPDPKVKH
jgi:DNA-directed RNA polymerase subunit RPC12/RpoP